MVKAGNNSSQSIPYKLQREIGAVCARSRSATLLKSRETPLVSSATQLRPPQWPPSCTWAICDVTYMCTATAKLLNNTAGLSAYVSTLSIISAYTVNYFPRLLCCTSAACVSGRTQRRKDNRLCFIGTERERCSRCPP